MRAFLSTGGGELREASVMHSLWPVAEVDEANRHAAREAERILYYSELQGTLEGTECSYLASARGYYGASAKFCRYTEPLEALAEALSSFLSLEL